MKHVIYLAGPLFTNSEQWERTKQAKLLRENGFEVYNPLEFNEIDKKRTLASEKSIFNNDIQAMEKCDFAIVNLDGLDSGTLVELGWFYANRKKVYVIWSDFRSERINNLFVLGACNWKLYRNLEEILEEMQNENIGE